MTRHFGYESSCQKSRGSNTEGFKYIYTVKGRRAQRKGNRFEVPGGGFIVIQRVRDIIGGNFGSKVQRPAAITSNQFGCAENGSTTR